MSPRPLKYCILLVLTLFCVSELARCRSLPIKSPGDVAAGKQLKEAGGEEKSPHGFTLSHAPRVELFSDAGYREAHDMVSCVWQEVLTNQPQRGPPQLATL